MKYRSLLLISFLFLSVSPAYALQFNEMHYNPEGNDNNKEFVEIKGANNLSGYLFGDLKSNDTLSLIQHRQGNFSLIVEEGFNYSSINSTVYSVGATLGDNLNNQGDTIFLYKNNTPILGTSYNASLANGNGYSLEWKNETWMESAEKGGSPGRENPESSKPEENTSENTDISIVTLLPSRIYSDTVYENLFRLENEKYESGGPLIDVQVRFILSKDRDILVQETFEKSFKHYSESGTGSLRVNTTGNTTLCGTIINTSIPDANSSNNISCANLTVLDSSSIPCSISIDLFADSDQIEEGNSFSFENIISNTTFPFSIEYWIEDLQGRIEKSVVETSNLYKKSFTPRFDEQDRVYRIKNKLVHTGCNNSLKNASSELIFFSWKNTSDEMMNSSFTIESITGNRKFGETIFVKILVKKGDTRKSAIKVWIDGKTKASQITTAYLYGKNKEIHIKLPVVLDVCGEKGSYDLVIEGLDLQSKKNIDLEENICSSTNRQKITTPKRDEIEFLNSSLFFTGRTFHIPLLLTNKEDEEKRFTIRGYVYKGSQSYSNKSENKISLSVPANSTEEIELEGLFTEQSGQYRFMVKVEKEGRKSITSYSKEILFLLPNAEILSLYSLAQKPGEVKLFTRVRGEGHLTLKTLTGNQETEQEIASEEKVGILVNASSGTRTMILLYENGVVTDAKLFLFLFPERDISETTSLLSKPQETSISQTPTKTLPTSHTIYEAEPVVTPLFWIVSPIILCIAILLLAAKKKFSVTL
ncbi:hypothetical protein CMO92_04945 [Candidatus Woesearchaeota archaeon]|nr:hypothetical protein [Candidatus Woesearchaeota archaeon]